MIKIKIKNFQNLHIQNAEIIKQPITQSELGKKDELNIVFLRNPYVYFEYILNDYLIHDRSMLFTQDIYNNLKQMNNRDFLKWLRKINFMPFYNPQTFQMDPSTRLTRAINILDHFDYVVPYEEIDIFLKHVPLDTTIKKNEEILSFKLYKEQEALEEFVDKDIKLYEKGLELWDIIKQNDFKPLGSLIERKKLPEKKKVKQKSLTMENHLGICGDITSNSITGWVFHKNKPESLMVEIYRNNKLLSKSRADKLRSDLKKREIHATGYCGFKVVFDEPTFKPGDDVVVKVLPEEENIPLSKKAKHFLKNEIEPS